MLLSAGCASAKPTPAPPIPDLPVMELVAPPEKADGMVRAIPDLDRREASFAQTWRALGLPERGVCMDEDKAMNAAELRVWAERHYTIARGNEALLRQSRALMWQDGWEERERRRALEAEQASFLSRHEHTIWLVVGISAGLLIGKAVFSD